MFIFRKENLLKELEKQKIKLEARKLRFKLWQESINRKDEKGCATVQELKKCLDYWLKERRLNDRIEFIDSKIYRLARVVFKDRKEAI